MKILFHHVARVPLGLFCLLLCSYIIAQDKKLVLGEHQLFHASHTDSPMEIDGKMNEPAWQKTETRSLDYFYGIEKDSDKQNATFRMLWDDAYLYAFFDCDDKFLTASETKRDGRPYMDDCAELFLIPAPDSLEMHYGFELNLYKASNDFIYLDNIYQGKKGSVYSYNPEFQVEVTYNGTLNDNSDIDVGWTMELAIPLNLFRGMEKFSPVQAGNQWAFLALRQERNDPEPRRRVCSTIFPVYGIENVHHARRFGLLEFVD
ncbi:MAG: carbohydrate-binding family 9-like protein [Saprospiraceae bacterium]|nr:carbohydrate-binding family 9-like protein [Saprospiraceae bacterium]